MTTKDPFAKIQAETRAHRRQHGCGAYTFNDGIALIELAQQHQSRRILELGTALGYTACCFAYGSPEAHVDTIEGDALHVQLAQQHIDEARLNGRITVHHGDFEAIIATLESTYDMIFFDGFAPSVAMLSTLRNLLTSNGVMICANLEMLHGEDADALDDALNDESQWQEYEEIEQGGTVVVRKSV